MITIISGKPGAGKTLYLAYLLGLKMLDGHEDYRKLKKELKTLKPGGFWQLELPPQKHLVYADFDLTITRRLKAYYLEGYQVAMPNNHFETFLLPFYATIGLDEGQRYYDSRMKLREEVYRFYQLHRQADYNIYIACQRTANLDKNVRGIADKIIVIDSCNLKKDKYGNIINITWNLVEFNSCSAAERYQDESDNKATHLGVKRTIKTDLPVWNWYKTKACRPAFLKDKYNETFSFSYHTPFNNTYEDYVNFNNTHSFFAPTGYYNKDKKTKEG